LGPQTTFGNLSQTIPTVPGQPYLLSCRYINPSGDTPNEFQVIWNGNTLLDLTNWGKPFPLNPEFIVAATSTNTVLQFAFDDFPSFLGLDEVTLQPFAAPTISNLAGAGGKLSFNYTTVPGFSYQVEYSTDLKTWNSLGSQVFATGYSGSASDHLGPDPTRFYRVFVLQPLFLL